jgi:hypothetical protein
MNKNTTYIVIAVLAVVIVVAGAASYIYLNNGGNKEQTTPTVSVAAATNLQFSANVTSQGTTVEYQWAGRDIHANNLTIRVDILGGASGNYSYILNAAQQKSWSSTDNGITWIASTDFATDWNSWGTQWTSYLDNLANWTGSGNYSYTNASGEAITLFNISVNQTIPDSTFQTS